MKKLLCLLLPILAHAGPVSQTQELLRSKTQRDAYIKTHPDAAQADRDVKKLSGSKATQQAIYETSGDVFKTLTDSTQDPAKQQALLQKAMSNPEEFLKSLPAAQQAKIRELASQIEKQNAKVAAPK